MIVNRYAAEAVLKGADVFSPGLMAVSAGVAPGDLVAVTCVLETKCVVVVLCACVLKGGRGLKGTKERRSARAFCPHQTRVLVKRNQYGEPTTPTTTPNHHPPAQTKGPAARPSRAAPCCALVTHRCRAARRSTSESAARPRGAASCSGPTAASPLRWSSACLRSRRAMVSGEGGWEREWVA